MNYFKTPAERRNYALMLKKQEDDKPFMIYDTSELDDMELDYECFINRLEELMEYLNPDNNPWYVAGVNMGWRRRSGDTIISLPNEKKAHTLLWKILPNDTDIYLEIFINKDEQKIRNSDFKIIAKHHDNPVSGDRYFVRVAS